GGVIAEIIGAHRALQDRHHAGDSRAAGNADEIAVFLRTEHCTPERPENLDFGFTVKVVEQPVTEAAGRLAFDDECRRLDLIGKIEHRIGPPAGNVGSFEHDELAGLKTHWTRQVQVEVYDVPGQ